MSNTRSNQVNDPNDVSLIDLPSDVLLTIVQFAPADKLLETIRLMSISNQSLYVLFKPKLTKSAVKKTLALAADSSVHAVPKLLKMLDKNPRLLLESGNVITRSDLIVENVTVYEFLLGAGDSDLSEQVATYFTKFEGGDDARIKQEEKYRPYIEGMLKQEPYGLTGLINIIKQASPAEVQAALNKQTTGSALDKALAEFRQAVTLKKITQPQMHYNYQTLIHALDLYSCEFDKLKQTSRNNFDKLDLVWRQVIGYLQRGLPAVDRFAFVMGLYDLVENKQPLKRTLNYLLGNGSFPDMASADSSLSGLGFDYAILAVPCHSYRLYWGKGPCIATFYKGYVEQKLQTYTEFMLTAPKQQSHRCVIV